MSLDSLTKRQLLEDLEQELGIRGLFTPPLSETPRLRDKSVPSHKGERLIQMVADALEVTP